MIETNWVDVFIAKQGLGACICEGPEINAVVKELQRLRIELANEKLRNIVEFCELDEAYLEELRPLIERLIKLC